MDSKIKVAVIGCGTIANSAHIPSYMKNAACEIKYFCDIIPARADAAVRKYGCGKAVYDYHEILGDPEVEAEIDADVVASAAYAECGSVHIDVGRGQVRVLRRVGHMDRGEGRIDAGAEGIAPGDDVLAAEAQVDN